MSRQARLGLVVLGGVLFFVLALFVLAQRTFLLSDTYRIKAQFDRVAGLQNGASVFYNGISVGRVERVALPERPGAPIEVGMAIRDDAKHLIREDSRAVIQTDGLVGNVIVSLTSGTLESPPIAEGGYVTGVNPLSFTDITDTALQSVARFDSVTVTMTDIMRQIQTGQGPLSQGTLGRFLHDGQLYEETLLTTQQTRVALRDLTTQAEAIVAIASDASTGINEIVQKVNAGDGTMARILNDDEIYEQLLAATENFSSATGDLRAVTDRAEDASNWATLGAFRFAENMEALKHNFLFKSYYEERGYLEKAPFEVRERALAETYRALDERAQQLYELERALEARAAGLDANAVTPPAPLRLPAPSDDAAEAGDTTPDGSDTAPGE
jgi:phospholipid/cholesterol/gamma-HCH transport system substrate-binding protein